jgi:hypothetical protein
VVAVAALAVHDDIARVVRMLDRPPDLLRGPRAPLAGPQTLGRVLSQPRSRALDTKSYGQRGRSRFAIAPGVLELDRHGGISTVIQIRA